MGFKDLLRWDVAGFLKTGWLWPSEVLQPMGSVVRRVVSEVDGKTPKNELPIIGKITFGGDLSLSDEDERLNYKGRLFWAAAGQLVFSKIRLKQGSFCIVPESLPSVAVSAEYPVFDIAEEKAVPAFLDLLLRSEYMKAVLDGLAHGGGTKTRIHPAQFEALEIPIPPLVQQQAIVSQWQVLQDAAQQAAARADACEAAGREAFLRALGLEAPVIKDKVRAFAVRWSDFDRWGVDQCRQSTQGVAQSFYPSTPISALAKIGSGGTPSRNIASYYGGEIPWVKTTEVRNALISDTEEKITEAGLSNSNAKLYPAGSLVIAMYGQGATRARTAKLAIEAATNQACCVLHEIDPKVQTDYLWFFLMSQYENLRAMASGNNQPNLNAGMIANYLIPLPPLNVQTNLVTAINEARAEAARLRTEAAQLRQQAQHEIEAALLGHTPAQRVDG